MTITLCDKDANGCPCSHAVLAAAPDIQAPIPVLQFWLVDQEWGQTGGLAEDSLRCSLQL
jgi:hypothetical protein